MKKVFIFEIKKLLVPLAIYFGIMSILGFVIMLINYDLDWRDFSTLFGIFMLFLMFGLVFIVFSYNKKRISADMTYSLPVTKRQLFLGKYLASLFYLAILALLYLIICFIIIFIAKSNGSFRYSLENQNFSTQFANFTLGSLLQMAVTIPLFNFILLFYYKANTVLDGICFIGFGFVLTWLVTLFILDLANNYAPSFSISMYIDCPRYFLEGPYQYNPYSGYDALLPIFISHVVLGYLITIYFIWFSKRDCSIRTQNISNGIFGYRVFLPLLAVIIPLMFIDSVVTDGVAYVLFVLTAIGLFIGYCLYHRSVKFNKESYMIYAITLVYNFIFLLVWVTN